MCRTDRGFFDLSETPPCPRPRPTRERPASGRDEELATAAGREFEEETGWRPGPLRPLLRVQPSNGLSDSVHHVFRADGATHIGPPTDAWEAERIEWVPLADVRDMVGRGDVTCGTGMAALLYVLTEP